MNRTSLGDLEEPCALLCRLSAKGTNLLDAVDLALFVSLSAQSTACTLE